jgi:hypothetical protein
LILLGEGKEAIQKVRMAAVQKKKNESQESLQNIKSTQNELYILINKTN